MDKNIGVITFEDYKVLKINYEVNDNFNKDLFTGDINFQIGNGNEIIDDTMVIQLGVKLFEGINEEKRPFNMEVIIEGVFKKKDKTINLEEFIPNGLSILYPYLRAIVSTYTTNANILPINLPTININEYLK